jgi:hypothetical protein
MPAGAAPGERRGGRAKGTRNRRSVILAEDARERVKHALVGKISPLEVLLEQMHWYRDQAEMLTAKIAELAVDISDPTSLTEFFKMIRDMGQFRQLARVCASDAAPYVHSKLASIELSSAPLDPDDGVPKITNQSSPKVAASLYEASLRT